MKEQERLTENFNLYRFRNKSNDNLDDDGDMSDNDVGSSMLEQEKMLFNQYVFSILK